jgi:hypothetical protein
LSARQVCELYRRRWRIEDAFALTKRLLDLAYIWTGSTNAVQLQFYATLIFYAVLLTICQQVAEVLGGPLERISVEMVFRAFYHHSRAVRRGECDNLVMFLVEHATLLGMVKRWRQQHRQRQRLESIMWGDPSVETGGYHPAHIWKIVRSLGWSCQVPERQPIQRDESAIAHWKRYKWPAINKSPPPGRAPRLPG